jgi:hypothetical protein
MEDEAMAFTNLESKQIHCKVLYVGAEGAGVTSNLQSILEHTKYAENRAYISREDEIDPFFEFLPLSMGRVADFDVRLHLYAMSIKKLYRSSIPVLLRGLDAIVYVLDSRLSKTLANIQLLEDLRNIFEDLGEDTKHLATVFQYNWRDHPEAMPVELLRAEFNPAMIADVESAAALGVGTMETLEILGGLLIDQLSQQHGK